MFSTSQDILNWAITVSVIAVAITVVWAMVYVIGMLRTLNDINRRVRTAIEAFTLVLAHLQDKIESTAGYLPLIVQAVTKLATYFMNKKNKVDDFASDETEMPPRRKPKK